MLKYEKKILDNGLRVVLAPMENTGAVTLTVLVGVGSRYETKEINGVSHFLEHLFFKGTKKRPTPKKIAIELDRVGASQNAFTQKEFTGFWVKTASRNFDIGLDMLSDMLLNPLLDKEEIEHEKGVILQEINMYEDEPMAKVAELLEKEIYGDCPMGWDIIGTKENIGRISREEIFNYRRKNYLAKNMVVVVAGNIDAKKVFGKMKKMFGLVKKGGNKKGPKVVATQNKPAVKIQSKETEQTHVAIGLRGFDMFDERKYALDVLSVILGGNMSSRLFSEIRDKLGLAYYVYATPDYQTDCGCLNIAAGVAHENLEKTVRKIIKIVGDIKRDGVPDKDLKHAKGFIAGQMAMRFESSSDVASYLASRELFFNKIIQPEEILKNIEKIGRNDILKVARNIFKPEKINVAVIGKHEDAKKKEELYKQLLAKI